jgi:hypothetical protein
MFGVQDTLLLASASMLWAILSHLLLAATDLALVLQHLLHEHLEVAAVNNAPRVTVHPTAIWIEKGEPVPVLDQAMSGDKSTHN